MSNHEPPLLRGAFAAAAIFALVIVAGLTVYLYLA